MLMPGIFANDLMDGFFDAPERNYKKSYYNKQTKQSVKMKYPLNALDDCNFNVYQLQLSLYA